MTCRMPAHPSPEVDHLCLFTIGYEGKSLLEYTAALKRSKVKLVVDVRKNPISRKKGFSKKSLSEALINKGIEYVHLPGLGIDSSRRKELKTFEAYKALFSWYRRTVIKTSAELINDVSDMVSKYKYVALTCFEKDPEYCHRLVVAELCKSLYEERLRLVHL